MVPMGWIGGPVRICVVRSDDLNAPTGSGNSMQLTNECHHVGDVFNDVSADDQIKFVVWEWIWQNAEVVNNIGVAARVGVNADRTRKLVLTTTDVQDFQRLLSVRDSRFRGRLHPLSQLHC